MGAKGKRGDDGMTDLERLFVVHYLEEFNATQAYSKASPRKVSRRTAETNGARLLLRPEIQAAIKAKRDELMAGAELSVKTTLGVLKDTLLFDPRKYFDSAGNLLPINELDDRCARALAGMEIFEEFEGSGKDRTHIGHTKKIKFTDRQAALDKAMRYHGLFEKDNTQLADELKKLAAGITFKLVGGGD